MISPRPASTLLSPTRRRAACPLASIPRGVPPSRRDHTRARARIVAAPGWPHPALLVVIIPARRMLLVSDAGAVLGLPGLFGGMAALPARSNHRQQGFWNAACPIPPIERLCGHRPLLRLEEARCEPCGRGSGPAGLDRSPREGLVALGAGARNPGRWLGRVSGVFVAGFAGVIVAFGGLPDSGPVFPTRAGGQVAAVPGRPTTVRHVLRAGFLLLAGRWRLPRPAAVVREASPPAAPPDAPRTAGSRSTPG